MADYKRNSLKYENDRESRVATGIGPMTDRILNSFVDKLSSDNFKEKIYEKIIEPVTQIVTERAKPYIYTGIALYVVVVVLLLIIIYMLTKKK